MSIPETTAPVPRPKTRWLLLAAYVPVACAVIGLLAYIMRLSVPTMGGGGFKGVFWSFAVPRPGTPSVLHLPGLAIGLLTLGFLILLSFSEKPPMTLFQVRIVLLVLIAVLTLLAKIWLVSVPLGDTGGDTGFMKLSLFLFFAAVDLVVVFLMTFLPGFRGLKARLV